MRFAFIGEEKASFPVALMCRVLKVSRAGFYAWRSRPAAKRTRQDQVLAAVVATIYTSNRGCYGSPRVHVELRERGHCVGRKRVARLMREQGFGARHKRRYRRTTDSRHNFPISANVLARRFAVMRPNAAWVRHHLYMDLRRLAVSGGDPRSVLAPDCGVVHERTDRPATGGRLPAHGLGPSTAARWTNPSFRSRQPVRQPRLPTPARRSPDRREHEPAWRLLGQRCRGKLFRYPENGTGLPKPLANACRRTYRYFRIYRIVL
jgi:hypothetical protein